MRPTTTRTALAIAAAVVLANDVARRSASAAEMPFADAAWTRERGRVSADISTTLEDNGFEDRIRVAVNAGPSVTATLSVPVGQVELGRQRRTGVRDATVAMRWIPVDGVRGGRRERVAVSAGFELPSGDPFGAIALGSGSVDFVLSAAAAHDSPRWYVWTEARGIDATPGQGAPESDSLAIAMAAGVRTKSSASKAPVFRAEGAIHALHTSGSRSADLRIRDSGGNVLSIGPGLVFEMSGHALRGGVQIPIFHSLRGFQEDPSWRAQFGFEVHR